MRLNYSACSHIGSVRQNNEDNLYVPGRIIPYESSDAVFSATGDTDLPCIFAVCDGMGGQEFGEYASYTTVCGLAWLEFVIKTEPPEKTDSLVQEYVSKINNTICEKMRKESAQIGTTLAMVIITADEIRAYNIGDSRIYALIDGELLQVSEDHNMSMQKVNMGMLTMEEARHDHDRNKLTRYLGMIEDDMILKAEPLPLLDIQTHCPILIASDGLTELVEDQKIKEVLQSVPAKDAAELLVIAALEKGGKDNVTCIVIDVLSEKTA